MGNNRTPIRVPVRHTLSPAEEMECWLGASHHGSCFRTHEELEQAWATYRDRLMERYAKGGRRPAIWWEIVGAALDLERNYETERSTLYEHGLLGKIERGQLLAYWRAEFEKAWQLTDTKAIARHIHWADIPMTLVETWHAEMLAVEEATGHPQPAA
jgi:hypothetical protein